MKRTMFVSVAVCAVLLLSGCAPPTSMVGGDETPPGLSMDTTNDTPRPQDEPIDAPADLPKQEQKKDDTLKIQPDGPKIRKQKQGFSKVIRLVDGILTIELSAYPTLPDGLVDELLVFLEENGLTADLEQTDDQVTITIRGEGVAEYYTQIDQLLVSYQPDIELPDLFVHQNDYWLDERPDLFDTNRSFGFQDWDAIEQHFQEVDRYMDEMRRQMFEYMYQEFQPLSGSTDTGNILEDTAE